MLHPDSRYSTFTIEDKHRVLQKIGEYTSMGDHLEIVVTVLEKIDPILEIEKNKKRIIIGRGTLDRIKEQIRKANLERYKNLKIKG
ncbi:hypothetical protein ABW636_09530 [Aquimarina sp. 2201CG1-2-11]|uniref:hypothetical protein n=1 Tax=Aquimarina discodermiae TaxID=3231043 RepID=UPI003462F77C